MRQGPTDQAVLTTVKDVLKTATARSERLPVQTARRELLPIVHELGACQRASLVSSGVWGGGSGGAREGAKIWILGMRSQGGGGEVRCLVVSNSS